MSTAWEAIATAPLNTSVIVFCSVLWFYMWNRRAGFEDVSVSYSKVLHGKQFYRILSAAFVHLNFMHIVFNMGSLFSVGMLEGALGSYYYLRTTILLLFMSMAMWMGITHILVTRFAMTRFAESSAVGYSAVIFGWMTVMSMFQPSGSLSLPMGLSIPYVIAPFISLFITQLIVPQASFMGHLAGIVAGYLIALHVFDWINDYWLWTTVAYLTILMIVSLKANANLPWLSRYIVVSPDFMRRTGMGAPVGDVEGASAPTAVRYMDGGVLRVATATPGAAIEGGSASGPPMSVMDRLAVFWQFGRFGGSTRAATVTTPLGVELASGPHARRTPVRSGATTGSAPTPAAAGGSGNGGGSSSGAGRGSGGTGNIAAAANSGTAPVRSPRPATTAATATATSTHGGGHTFAPSNLRVGFSPLQSTATATNANGTGTQPAGARARQDRTTATSAVAIADDERESLL